jgi:hypothetical protein
VEYDRLLRRLEKLEAETEVIKEKLKGDVQLLSKEIATKVLGREAGV